MNYQTLFSLITKAEDLLASNLGGKTDVVSIEGFHEIAKAMLEASANHPTVEQKASAVLEWAGMLYRPKPPAGYTFDQLRIFIGNELGSLRKALQILEKR